MQPETGKMGFKIRYIDNKIHEFTWLSSSDEAVDVWMKYNDALYSNTNAEQTVYFLHLIKTAQFPSLSYVVRKARELQQKYSEQPRTRSAVLIQSRFYGGFINMLSNLLNQDEKDITKIFAIDERDEAIEWLLSDEV